MVVVCGWAYDVQVRDGGSRGILGDEGRVAPGEWVPVIGETVNRVSKW